MNQGTELITLKVRSKEKRTFGQKLSRTMQLQVCLDLAYDLKPTQIAASINDEFMRRGLPERITADNIYQSYVYNAKWQKIIKFFRDRHYKSLSRYAACSSTWRLKHLQDAFLEACGAGNMKAVAALHSAILDETLGRRAGVSVKVATGPGSKTQIFSDLTPEHVEEMPFADRIRAINDRLSKQFK